MKYIVLWIFLFGTSLSASPKIAIVTIPKSGTHLIKKCVELLTKKRPRFNLIMHQWRMDGNHVYSWSHSPATQKNIDMFIKNEMKGIWFVRDPRDQIVSFAWSLKKREALLAHVAIEAVITGLIMNTGEFIHCVSGITSYLAYEDVDAWYRDFLSWKTHPCIMVSYYENLVGPQGGGDLAMQEQEVCKIAEYLNVDMPYEEIRAIASKLFGGTATFVFGQIGRWKQVFTPEHKKLFKQKAGQLLIDLGYEKDFAW